MEKYYHSYDVSYEKFTPEWFSRDNQKSIDKFLIENSESMSNFLDSYLKQFSITNEQLRDKDILIAGCGFGGLCHYFTKKGVNLTGIDVSSLAIVGAKEIAKNKDIEHFEFKQIDVCKDQLDTKFDYIIDDHLLHCLTTDADRVNYLSFVKDHLKDGGQFLVETMAFQNRVQTPVEFSFDENYVLWQKDLMIRKILPSIEIEKELLDAALKINYLYYHSELAFQVFPSYPDYPFEYLPRTVRLAATK